MQLTFEQHKFQLHRPTYTWFFFSINTTLLHDRWLVESLDAELQIQREPLIRRADYKLYTDFQLCKGSAPQPPVLYKHQLVFYVMRVTVTAFILHINV